MPTQRALFNWVTPAALVSALIACNDSDPVAHPADAGAAWNCDYASQLARHQLPTGLANVFVDCEWPLRASDAREDLTWLIGEPASVQADRAAACSPNPQRWWQVPASQQLPLRFVYCPKACEAVRMWVRCKLRDDPCSAEAPAADGGDDCE